MFSRSWLQETFRCLSGDPPLILGHYQGDHVRQCILWLQTIRKQHSPSCSPCCHLRSPSRRSTAQPCRTCLTTLKQSGKPQTPARSSEAVAYQPPFSRKYTTRSVRKLPAFSPGMDAAETVVEGPPSQLPQQDAVPCEASSIALDNG